MSTYGALNIAFNNAGVFAVAPFADISEEMVDTIMGTNVKSIIFCFKYQVRFDEQIHRKQAMECLCTEVPVLPSMPQVDCRLLLSLVSTREIGYKIVLISILVRKESTPRNLSEAPESKRGNEHNPKCPLVQLLYEL